MLPKSKYTSEASQYRPITCLLSIYKILTSVLTNKINAHIEHHKIIAENRKDADGATWGAKNN